MLDYKAMSLYKFFLSCMALFLLTSCNKEIVRENKPIEQGTGVAAIAKSDIDNVLDVHIRESRRLLKELMIKL